MTSRSFYVNRHRQQGKRSATAVAAMPQSFLVSVASRRLLKKYATLIECYRQPDVGDISPWAHFSARADATAISHLIFRPAVTFQISARHVASAILHFSITAFRRLTAMRDDIADGVSGG